MSKKNDEKYLPLDQFISDENLNATVMYKPKLAYYMGMIFGALLCFAVVIHWSFALFGLFILSLSWLVGYFIQDYKVLAIYDTYVLVYDTEAVKARKVTYEEIVEWGCKHGKSGADSIMFKLKDDEVIYKDTFLSTKAYHTLNKLIPEKESQAVKDKENTKTKLQFRVPFIKKDRD